jgi:signal transduction histidine kinase
LAHTPVGSTITISASEAGAGVMLEITDDGPGISHEHLERIFERFYRVDGAQGHGSGLGLAIAREVAGRMGGRVDVTSAPGGTRFTLALPATPPLASLPVST